MKDLERGDDPGLCGWTQWNHESYAREAGGSELVVRDVTGQIRGWSYCRKGS